MIDKSLIDRLKNSKISLNTRGKNKAEILKKLIELFELDDTQKSMLLKAVLQREELGSTGIGNGIAIPHTRSLVVTDLRIAIGRPAEPVDFDSIDEKPVRLIFLIVAPPYTAKNEYLVLLGKIAETFQEVSSDEKLYQVSDEEEFIKEFCRILECNNG